MRNVRLGLEILETRTVLSAVYGASALDMADYSDSDKFALSAVDREARGAFANQAQTTAQPLNLADFGRVQILIVVWHVNHAPSDFQPSFLPDRPPLGVSSQGIAYSTFSAEDGYEWAADAAAKQPQGAKAPADAGAAGNYSAEPPMDGPLGLETAFNESRSHWLSPFMAPTVDDSGSSAANTSANLLRSAIVLDGYLTTAANISAGNQMLSAFDAAFDSYSALRPDASDVTSEWQLALDEDDSADSADRDAHLSGFVDLADAASLDDESLANESANAQRESIEAVLRTLSKRRSPTNPELSIDPESADAVAASNAADLANGDGSAADQPGGMILLRPGGAGAENELAAAGPFDVVEVSVDMEAAIGAYQAFDVATDKAPVQLIKPAPASELGQRPGVSADATVMQPTEETPHRRAAAGVGVLALGALSFAAKREIDDRQRKPR